MKLPIVMPGGASTDLGVHRAVSVHACPRQHRLRYVLNRRPKRDKSYRKIGTLVHYGAAWYWASRMQKAKLTPPEWYRPDLVKLPDIIRYYGQGYPKEIEQAIAVMRYYVRTHTEQAWLPIAIEENIRVPLGELRKQALGKAYKPQDTDDAIVSGRLDLIVIANGYVYVVDYKNQGKSWNGKEGLPKWNDDGEYALPFQQIVQLHLARYFYRAGSEALERISRHLSGVARANPVRNAIIERIKRAAPYDHDANTLDIPPLAYEEALDTLHSAVLREREYKRAADAGLKVPAHFGSACWGRYGPCDYYDFCRAKTPTARRQILEDEFQFGEPLDDDQENEE